MDKIRAKFRVHNVSVTTNGPDGPKLSERVQMGPVYSSDPASENYSFSQYTPAGAVEMSITNPAAFGFFQEGQDFYLDFTPAQPQAGVTPEPNPRPVDPPRQAIKDVA